MANDLTFTQVSTVLNSIVSQATGQATITPTDTSSFVNVAQTALKMGYDPVINAISQVLSRTIFSVRPYYRKFRGLEVSAAQWGNMTRKLSIADKPLKDDDRFDYPVAYDATRTDNPTGNGLSVDQYALNKPDILQTNFYGLNVFEDSITIFRDQLDVAFSGPDEFGRFVSMVMQNMTDKLEQSRENMARATIANLAGALIDEANTSRVIHLLTEYNAATGKDLSPAPPGTGETSESVYLPENFIPFMRWAYARVAAISSLMTERSTMFQTVVNNKPVMRHTPYERQRVFLYAPSQFQMEAEVLADTYHDNYIRYAPTETVNFWQSIKTPDTISITPGYTSAAGVATKGAAVNQSGIFGIIFDEEAAGYAITQQWSNPTPFNARGGYTNIWFHETQKNWIDNTEKAVILLLD